MTRADAAGTSTVDLFSLFLRAYPLRSAAIVVALVLAGLAEGVGLVTLLPLLELTLDRGKPAPSPVAEAVAGALSAVRLEPTLEILLGLVVLVMSLKAVLLLLAMRQVGYTVAHVGTDLRLTLIRGLLQARWGYFVTQPAGHISNAIGAEAHRAAGAYRDACSVLAGAIQVLVYVLIAALVSWHIALLSLLAGTFAVLVLWSFVRMARVAGQHQTQLMKSLAARLTDALSGIKPIKAMARERHLLVLLEEETQGLNRAQERQVLASEGLKALQEPLVVALLAVGLYVVTVAGEYPFSTVLVMAFLFYRLVGRIHSLQSHYQSMSTTESAFWSMRASIERAESRREENPGVLSPPPVHSGIRLEHVHFGYGEHEVLHNVSLTFPAGAFVAIVGPSGAGKTTIADLTLGLYRPDAGEVYVDDVALGEVDLHAWRRMIGYVPQEMFLFHDTIVRNVTLGDEEISRADVERALRTAGAWDFVAALPQGIDTVVGERGAKLSGGQRQRIAIARALVGRPRVLVLDEVTTALDTATEAAICQTLSALRPEVTIISISHQAAMMETADVVLELVDGRVSVLRGAGALSHPAIA